MLLCPCVVFFPLDLQAERLGIRQHIVNISSIAVHAFRNLF